MLGNLFGLQLFQCCFVLNVQIFDRREFAWSGQYRSLLLHNNFMKNKLGRNRRTFDILQIQQQISHYNHLIQAKADVSTGGSSQHATPSRFRSKFYNEVERSRLLENSKLVRKLTEIKHSKGLLHEDNYR